MSVKRRTKRDGSRAAKKSSASKLKHASQPRTQGTAAKSAARGVTPQPLIAVRDVISSSRWYQAVLGATSLGEGSDQDDVYDRLYAGDRLILQLHSWDNEEHSKLTHADGSLLGHGVLLWFELDDFDAAVERAGELGTEILEPVHVNEAAAHREIWLRDPDGYVVVLASPEGDSG